MHLPSMFTMRPRTAAALLGVVGALALLPTAASYPLDDTEMRPLKTTDDIQATSNKLDADSNPTTTTILTTTTVYTTKTPGPRPDKPQVTYCHRTNSHLWFSYQFEFEGIDDGFQWCKGFRDNLDGRGCAITYWHCRPKWDGLSAGPIDMETGRRKDTVGPSDEPASKQATAYFDTDVFCDIHDIKGAFMSSAKSYYDWTKICKFEEANPP